MTKRVGELYILEREYTLELIEAMPKMKVHSVEYQVWIETVKIICECAEFEVVPEGCMMFEYEVELEIDKYGDYDFIKFKKKEEC